MKRITAIAAILAVCSSMGLSQTTPASSKQDSSANKNRLKKVILTEAALYGGSLLVLNNLWYKDYPRSSFHFFNDTEEWLQMDKFGHSATSYLTGRTGYEMFRWSGLNEKQSTLFGGSLGFLYLLNIEILDGFSKEWGASLGDIAANSFGSGLFISQQLIWNEQKLCLKYSFHQTPYSRQREDLLGSNFWENSLKDYNGQTYWLSANIKSFCNKNTHVPPWLNMAIGYGAEEMLEGIETDAYLGYKRYRQYYISPDIDFTKIKTSSKFLKRLFFVVNVFKFPAPTLELSKNRLKAHLLYF